MKVWQITVGEPSPAESKSVRLLRTGILSKELTQRGHDVTWWSSSFDHFGKKFLSSNDKEIAWEGGTLSLLHTKSSYSSNVSLQRIRHNLEVAEKFAEKACENEKPDVILCSFPTIELAYEAVKYGQKNNVPVVIDIRDLWPDVYLTALPSFLHSLGRLALQPFYKKAHYILKHCQCMTAVSKGYLDWGIRLGHRSPSKADSVFPIGYMSPPIRPQHSGDNEYLEHLRVPKNSLVVWFVGSFGRSYDLETVLNAAQTLQGRGDKSFYFVISGDGDAMPRLKQKAMGLKNTVFTGWIEADKIKALQARADIGLMAYAKGAKQGMPNKLFEYMSAGIPILSSLEGEGEEVIRQYQIGQSYTPGSSQDLVEKLLKLEPAGTREKIRTQCNLIFEKNFSADTIYSNFADYLEHIKSDDKEFTHEKSH